MEPGDWSDPERRFLGMSVYAPRGTGDIESERAVIYLNAGDADIAVTLPSPRADHAYCLHLQSDWPQLEPRRIDAADALIVQSRSVFVILEERL